jgi:uncharacterized membrane protein
VIVWENAFMCPSRQFVEKSFDRLIFFSDAVVAIALTLLALPLVDIAREEQPLGEMFWENSGSYIAFGLSFVVIFALWRRHHRLFGQLISADNTIMWWNALWLAAIVFLPAPTAALVPAATLPAFFDPNAAISVTELEASQAPLYIGTMLCATVAERMMAAQAQARPELLSAEAARDGVIGLNVLRGWLFSALVAVALILSLTFPWLGATALYALFLSAPIQRIILRRRGHSSKPNPSKAR